MDITLTVKGNSITVPDGTRLVCSNDYGLLIVFADAETEAAWSGLTPSVHVACTQDDADAELDLLVTDGAAALEALPACRSIRVYLHAAAAGGAEKRTETLAIPCELSVLDQGSAAYSAPFDAYNAMTALLNGRLSGRYSREQIIAAIAELSSHTTDELNRTAYLRAVESATPETQLTGTLTLADSTEIEVTSDVILSSSVTLSTSALRDSSILPGAVPAAELKATIMADAGLPHTSLSGAELALTFEIMQENGAWGAAPLGVHTVYSIGDDTATGTPVTAYDDMKRLDAIPLGDAGFVAGRAYTPGQIIQTVCETAGIAFSGDDVDFSTEYANNGRAVYAHEYVVVALGTLPDSWGWSKVIENADGMTDAEVAARLAEMYGVSVTYEGTVTYPDDLPTVIPDTHIAYRVRYEGPRYIVLNSGYGIVTARDLLMHTLASINAYGYMDRDRILQIKPIKKRTAQRSVSGNQTLRQRVSRLQYQLYSLTTVCDYPEDGVMVSEERTEYTLWAEGVKAQLPSNPLLAGLVSEQPRADIFGIVNALADALDPVTFKPTRIETYGDPSIEPFEWIDVQTKTGTIAVPASQITWKYRGTQTIDTGGAEAVAGLELSQAEKIVIADKLEASRSTRNNMRNVYERMMQTHEGLHSFRHSEIAHYQYNIFKKGAT